LANYLKFATLEEAESQKSIHTLFLCKFCYSDKNFNQCTIEVDDDNAEKNEIYVPGQSCTQKAKAHEFVLNENKDLIRIIDTPGMGDSRGIEVDKKNYEETINYLSQLEHINGIVFLLKPNMSRLTPGFRYCFKELLVYLDKRCIENIVFCFTNSRSNAYRLTFLKIFTESIY
jgi:hypothetical protein